MVNMDGAIEFREGNESDLYDTFLISEKTYADLLKRMGSSTSTSISDPEKLTNMWEERRPLYNHPYQTADQFWVAEAAGKVVGFSRSIVRGSLRELTELFVLPDQQSSGVGRELIRLAFPEDGSSYRTIIATADLRAQALYLKSGVYPRFQICYFGRQPEVRQISSELEFRPMGAVAECDGIFQMIDSRVLDHQRGIDHAWLRKDREGYLYFYKGTPIGYGYVGVRNGPFALVDASHFPDVLGHAENQAAASGRDHFGVEVPMVNQIVVDYLLKRGFKLDTFMAVMMTNKEFGRFENYLFTSPPFFM